MFKGTSVQLGDDTYILPPLSLEKLEELEPEFRALAEPSLGLSERLKKLMPILLASFQRNYPDVSERQLRTLLDLPALNQLVAIIMEVNGFRVVEPGEPAPVQA